MALGIACAGTGLKVSYIIVHLTVLFTLMHIIVVSLQF